MYNSRNAFYIGFTTPNGKFTIKDYSNNTIKRINRDYKYNSCIAQALEHLSKAGFIIDSYNETARIIFTTW